VLARGVPRTRLLVAKAVVAGSFSLAAVVVIPLAGLLAGVIAWGWHPLVAVDGSVAPARAAVFAPLSALGWLGLSTLYVAAGMVSIFAFAFFLSTLTTRPLVAVSGGVGLTIVSRVLNADYLPGVAVLNGYMPNNDVDLWQHFLQRPVDGAGMAHFLVLQVVYGVVFGGLAWWWFRRKDVLS